MDSTGTLFSLFESVGVSFPAGSGVTAARLMKEPFSTQVAAASVPRVKEVCPCCDGGLSARRISCEAMVICSLACDFSLQVTFECKFMGHYAEPVLPLKYKVADVPEREMSLKLTYDPYPRTWTGESHDDCAGRLGLMALLWLVHDIVQFVRMGQRLRMLLLPHWAACTSTEVV